MKVYQEISALHEFEAWSGAIDTQEKIITAGKADEFMQLIEEMYPEGISDTGLNDLLWFEEKWIFSMLNIDKNDFEDDEE